MITFNIHTGEIVEQTTCGKDEREITPFLYPLFDYKKNYIGYVQNQDEGVLFLNAGTNRPRPDPNETVDEKHARVAEEYTRYLAER